MYSALSKVNYLTVSFFWFIHLDRPKKKKKRKHPVRKHFDQSGGGGQLSCIFEMICKSRIIFTTKTWGGVSLLRIFEYFSNFFSCTNNKNVRLKFKKKGGEGHPDNATCMYMLVYIDVFFNLKYI